ncbi:GNAT family N-acetyltransferase [Bradyrhizobium daqingense]|uniref:Ribosomal protein S18 acetylase RimI-like enzyme n=1 Tax=Bradyrhizobium daqingense TaxID=993502 RepID=A0A562KU38_9BRAD|nr:MULTISPECIES: GNAT family N-acetyltransferase [Bradyrhizobium]MDQ8731366.1 GNAT family N-acetyltransferase [Bradyrhizobium sp. LHD-71]TWH98864.1 ribosomal protein S18 acetylase RimI-like enzyme [Bradyrhizobium daqingense]UFS87801.1 GNAT family N-acetyltransferase [Bradyrhizobium daqingense]
MSKPHWRPARASDLAAISAIAARIHPGLFERTDVLAEKMRLCPDGCRVLAADEAIVGYGLAHPWKQHRIPPLDGFLTGLPHDADCLYVHDVAVLPDARGGVARAYIAMIEQLARASGITALALVSVYATQPLWQRLGFRPVAADAELRTKLASYGEGATYMLRDLAAA